MDRSRLAAPQPPASDFPTSVIGSFGGREEFKIQDSRFKMAPWLLAMPVPKILTPQAAVDKNEAVTYKYVKNEGRHGYMYENKQWDKMPGEGFTCCLPQTTAAKNEAMNYKYVRIEGRHGYMYENKQWDKMPDDRSAGRWPRTAVAKGGLMNYKYAKNEGRHGYMYENNQEDKMPDGAPGIWTQNVLAGRSERRRKAAGLRNMLPRFWGACVYEGFTFPGLAIPPNPNGH